MKNDVFFPRTVKIPLLQSGVWCLYAEMGKIVVFVHVFFFRTFLRDLVKNSILGNKMKGKNHSNPPPPNHHPPTPTPPPTLRVASEELIY